MAQLSSRLVLDIYSEFKNLSGAEPRELVRFYENNQSSILYLAMDKFFDLQVSYIIALFEIGSYQKLLGIIDEPIELSIISNIKKHNGKDVFRKLLYIKGAAMYHTMQFYKSKHIFLELIKMTPTNVFYKEALAKTMRKIIPQFVKNCRAVSIMCFIFSAIVIAVEMLVFQHFFPNYVVFAEWTRNILFALGWFTLIGVEFFHFFLVRREVEKIAQANRSNTILGLK